MTFCDLFQKIDLKRFEKKPTAKQLRECGDATIGKHEKHDVEITAFRNGYAIYKNAYGTTVVDLRNCFNKCEYKYSFNCDDSSNVPASATLPNDFLKSLDWAIVLTLFGENAIAQNVMNKKGDRTGMRVYVALENTDSGISFLDSIIQKENIEQILDCLNEKERTAVDLYYVQQFTQQEIADRMNMKQQGVSAILQRAIKKIKKIF